VIPSHVGKREEQKQVMSSLQLNLNSLSATPKNEAKSPSLVSEVVSYKGAAYFKIRARIGEGAVGEVYQVVHKKTLELFALKRVSKITAQMVSHL